jgi:hypothetical protein
MTQRLVVAWQHPAERWIEPIGFLSRGHRFYRFVYIRNAQTVKDFQPLLGFQDFYREYSSPELFPLFAERVMDPRRPDYHRYVERLGLEGQPHPWELITRSQGRRLGDTLQFLPEPVTEDNKLICLFLVNGIRHVPDGPITLDGHEFRVTKERVSSVLEGLRTGDALRLVNEPGNPFNPLAIVVTGALIPVGWMPNLLLEDLHRLMESAKIKVTVERANGPDAPWHLRLLARLEAEPANDFRFFTGERWAPLASELAQ